MAGDSPACWDGLDRSEHRTHKLLTATHGTGQAASPQLHGDASLGRLLKRVPLNKWPLNRLAHDEVW
jgi:hypothetical protein